MNWTIRNGRLADAPDKKTCDIAMIDGLIASEPVDGTEPFDAEGGLVLPGIIDLHGDAFERAIQPRAGVLFDTVPALRDADRQVVANGITTVFHAITVSWESGLRSVDTARDIVTTINAGGFLADTLPHLRWEVFATDATEEVLAWLKRSPHAMLSLNDHTSAFLDLTPPSAKLDRMAARMGIAVSDVQALLRQQAERQAEVPAAIEALCVAASRLGVPILAHDERSAAERKRHRQLGVTVCEFPVTLDAAREAASAQEPILLGAPNVVRGGSHTGAIDAAHAIADGLGTVLVSDYHYPSLMQAAFRLAGPEQQDLARSWALISRAPALAAGLADRGAVQPGLRADILVFWPGSTRLRAVFVAGRKVAEYG